MSGGNLRTIYPRQQDAVRDMLYALRVKRKESLEGLDEVEQRRLETVVARMRLLNGDEVLDLLLAYRGLARNFR